MNEERLNELIKDFGAEGMDRVWFIHQVSDHEVAHILKTARERNELEAEVKRLTKFEPGTHRWEQEKRIGELESELHEQTNRNAKTMAERDALKLHYDAANRAVGRSPAMSKPLSAYISDMRNERDAWRDTADTLRHENEQLRASNAALREALQTLVDRFQRVTGDKEMGTQQAREILASTPADRRTDQ